MSPSRVLAVLIPLLLVVSSVALADQETPPVVQVPFACGRAFVVSQAHEVGSHLQYDRDAWDFRMPDGIPIVSASAGVVRLARGDSTTGGCDPKHAREANYVVVDHGNGLETQYLHFSKVVVKPGDKVQAGTLLGYSGRTGWACGSHLHFKVARAVTDGWNNPSVRAHIAGYGDPQEGVVLDAGPCSELRPFIAAIDLRGGPDAGTPAVTGIGSAPIGTTR